MPDLSIKLIYYLEYVLKLAAFAVAQEHAQKVRNAARMDQAA
jgi:hypothetical protein